MKSDFRYNLHNSLSVDPTPRQTNPVHVLPAYILKLNYCDYYTPPLPVMIIAWKKKYKDYFGRQ